AEGGHSHAAAPTAGSSGILARLARGFSRVSRLLLPEPLHAFYLHGGVNTTVYNTSSPPGPGLVSPESLGGIESAGAPFVVEMGTILDVNPANSTANIPVPWSILVDDTYEIIIQAKDPLGQLYPYLGVGSVVVTVEGANQGTLDVTNEGGGTYRATFEPTAATDPEDPDIVNITINGQHIQGSPFEVTVLPLSGDIQVTVDIEEDVTYEGMPLEKSLPVQLYGYDENGVWGLIETKPTNDAGVVTFFDKDFGSYAVHMPARDFDVEFTTTTIGPDVVNTCSSYEAQIPCMTQSLEHASAPSAMTFAGVQHNLWAGVEVHRVQSGGNGNAFQYVLNNRSWTAANNDVRDAVLNDVQGHLATIFDEPENTFVQGLVAALCLAEGSRKQCRQRGWIGLTDEAVDEEWIWVTGERLEDTGYANWIPGNEPTNRNNEDHVEMNVDGEWSDENGASSTNEGYVVEWDADQPDETPPPPSGG
ncbi:lectin-like protein, partial [Gemmatimonadota bacterium]